MKHKMKIGKGDVAKYQAVAHVIGQYQRLESKPVDTVKIASFLGVTKPTAIKYLNMMQSAGYVELISRQWRDNAMAYSWRLTIEAVYEYNLGTFERHYRFYHACILQIAEMRGRGTVSI
jgi:hypothetical protein